MVTTHRLLCSWNSLGKNTEVSCSALLQRGKVYFATNEWIVKGSCDMSPERKGENCRESFSLLGEYPSNFEQNFGRNMDSKGGHSDEVSDGNEEHVIEHWIKNGPCDTVAKTWLICVHV